MLAWEEAYRIGLDEMDAQHLILFSLLNQLTINIDNDMAHDCVGDVLGALGSYIDYHFAHEEALMRHYGYPGLAAHSRQHQAFVAEVARLRENAGPGGDVLASALRTRAFVLDWLLDHILTTDVDYARFVSDKTAVPCV